MSWLVQEGFFSGEVSPRAYPLSSAAHIKRGAKVARNALLTGQGTMVKRSGSRHVAFTDTLTGDAITIPYKTTGGGKYIVVLSEKVGSTDVVLKVIEGYSFIGFADTETHGPIPASDDATHYNTPYTVAEIPEIHYFQSSNILFLLHPKHPPHYLERTTDSTGNETWNYGLAPFYDTSPQVDYHDTGIGLTVDPANQVITSSTDLFSPEDVNTIWKYGGPSIDDYPAGSYFSVLKYLSPTQIEYRDEWFWPIDENNWGTDATDWCGPFELSGVTISGGGTAWEGDGWVHQVNGITRSDGLPVDHSMIGTILRRARYWIVVGVVPATNTLNVLRLNTYGPGETVNLTGELYEMGTRHGVKRPYYACGGTWSGGGSDFDSLLTTDGVVMSSGGDFLPVTHEQHFDGVDGVATIGGSVFVQGGVGRVTSKNEDGSYNFTSTVSRSHCGPTFRLGIGMSKGSGFPSVGTNHQGRSVLAGYQGKYSEAITIGKSGEPLNFSLGRANAGDGMLLKAVGEGRVSWVDSNRDLLVGTESAEFRASGVPITPDSTILMKTSAYGGRRVMPVRLGATTVFVGRDGKSLYQSSYNDRGDTYDAMDMTDLADHLFTNDTIEQVVMVSQPDVLVWVRLSSGTLCALNWKPATEAVGWTSFKTGNTTLSGATDVVNWISTLPALTAGASHDNLWVVVDRVNGANTHKAIEAFGTIYTLDQEATYSISETLAGDGATSTEVLSSHLQSQQVQVLVDGVYLGEVSLDATGSAQLASFNIASSASTLTLGRKVFFELVPMVMETAIGRSPTHGKRRNYSRILVYVQNTRGLEIESYAIDPVPLAPPTEAVPVLGGWVDVPVLTDYGTHPVITISQSVPYQIEVSAVNAEVSFGD